MKSAFEPGALFVEVQDHDLVEQPVLNKILTEMPEPVTAIIDPDNLRSALDASAARK